MQSAEKISVTMPADMLREVREAVQRGDFSSTSDALRVWQRQRLKDAERLAGIRDRVRRSLDDPRPDLSFDDTKSHLADLHARTVKAHPGAKA